MLSTLIRVFSAFSIILCTYLVRHLIVCLLLFFSSTNSFSSAKSKLIGVRPIAVSITSKPTKVQNVFFDIKLIVANFATKNGLKMELL